MTFTSAFGVEKDEREKDRCRLLSTSAMQQLGSLLVVACRTKLYLLLLACFIFSLGLSIVLPVLPQLATNFFASQHAGYGIKCEEFDLSHQPEACQSAHADVVQWTSLNSLLANTFIALLFAPLVGDLSDAWGRKPFILAGIALQLLPLGAVWMHLTHHTSLLWYYPLNALTAVVTPIISFLSYAADVLQPELRTAGFGLITAAFSLGYTIGPSLGNVMRPDQAALAAASAVAAALLVVVGAVPESRPPAAAAAHRGEHAATAAAAGAAATAQPSSSPAAPPAAGTTAELTAAAAVSRPRRPLDAFGSLGRSWRLINSSSLFKRLALCMAVVGVVQEGIQDMLLQYLQLVMGFTTADQTVLITILGASNLVVQALLLPYLTKALGERHLLVTGLLFSVLEQAFLALAIKKWQAVAAVSLGAFAGVSFPAISSLKSTHASADQQGLVQGALAGIRALSSGLGPLGLAQLFAMSTTAEATFGYQPAIVFWTTCALTVVAAAVAASIPLESVKTHRPDSTSGQSAAAGHTSHISAHTGHTCDRNCSNSCAAAWLLSDAETGCCKAAVVADQHHKPVVLQRSSGKVSNSKQQAHAEAPAGAADHDDVSTAAGAAGRSVVVLVVDEDLQEGLDAGPGSLVQQHQHQQHPRHLVLPGAVSPPLPPTPEPGVQLLLPVSSPIPATREEGPQARCPAASSGVLRPTASREGAASGLTEPLLLPHPEP